MKKIILICFIALAGLIGCKKENVDKKNNKTLQGTWVLQKELHIFYQNDVESNRYEDDKNSMSFTFNDNSLNVKFSDNSIEEYTYTLIGEKFEIKKINTTQYEHANLKFNTTTQIIILFEESSVSNNITTKHLTEYTYNKK